MEIKYYNILFILLSFCCSCKNKCIVNNIEISELLYTVSQNKSINYCKLLKTAIKGDSDAIKKLSLLEFYDAAGYDHGSVIVDLIFSISEEKYIKSISTINRAQKDWIKCYIDVGIEYSNNPLIKHRDFKTVFPDLYLFLTCTANNAEKTNK